MKALAIETTSRRAAAALVEDGRVVDEAAFAAGLNHTAGFLPLVADLLCRNGWKPFRIDRIYSSIGPGGFTGTRVGVTFSKTLAFATGARVVAVPTPRVLVENLPPEARTGAVVIDARRGKIWAERFEREVDGWRSSGPGGLTTMADLSAALPRPAWLVGEGVAYHREKFDESLLICNDNAPRPAVVAALGAKLAAAGAFTDPFALAPAYVRRPEAEEKRLGLAP